MAWSSPPRALADYRAMFDLSDAELTAGPILDCPGGASPFGTQVRALGGTVVSVDPAYRSSREELRKLLTADLARIARWTAPAPDVFCWPYLGSPAALQRYFALAADMFLADYQPDGQRYVAAALPNLPFADHNFRLALCSHLLFCHPEFLDYQDHLTALRELVRVSGEVRVYPLVDTVGRRYPQLDALRTALDQHGITTEIRRTTCVYTVGADSMLVCQAEDTASRRVTRRCSSGG